MWVHYNLFQPVLHLVGKTVVEGRLKRTWDATPDPKIVIAAGDCARDGGIFGGSYAVVGGVSAVIPVDAVIPGCPPSPRALLAGLLAAIGRRTDSPR